METYFFLSSMRLWENPYDLDDDFLDASSRAKSAKKINLNCIKTKNFFPKDTAKRMKKQATLGENLC